MTTERKRKSSADEVKSGCGNIVLKGTGAKTLLELYPAKVSKHFAAIIESENDPIWKQCMPSPKELENPRGLHEDGLAEESQSPVPRLIHRYKDRALILTTNSCFTHCRFCFRKRLWKEKPYVISDSELGKIVKYLTSHTEIKDVLLSGGDPLTISAERLLKIVKTVTSLKSVETVRICSRALAFEPECISASFARGLGKAEKVWFMAHFNHPRELTPETVKACRRLQRNSIPILSQTVLLSGVNDEPRTLMELFRSLAGIKVKPHYLFHVDPVKGVSHFATGVRCGLELMKVFRKELSSIATPVFAIDLPEGGGKVQLFPDYSDESDESVYLNLDNEFVRHPLA